MGHPRLRRRLTDTAAIPLILEKSGENTSTAVPCPSFVGDFDVSLSLHRFDEVPDVMTIRLHRGDLPDLSRYTDSAAIDTETMGLNPHRDRLCVVQMSNGDGTADVIQIPKGHTDAPNLKALLANPKITKIFHFARFDLAALYNALGVMPQPVYCTKIASRLSRTYTDRHGLKDLVREVLNIDLSKQQQSSDWGSASLSEAQLAYAASDVLHLHALRERLDAMLAREGRTELAQACFDFLPSRARLDLGGWEAEDIFAHS
jgi:ribonuclease D